MRQLQFPHQSLISYMRIRFHQRQDSLCHCPSFSGNSWKEFTQCGFLSGFQCGFLVRLAPFAPNSQGETATWIVHIWIKEPGRAATIDKIGKTSSELLNIVCQIKLIGNILSLIRSRWRWRARWAELLDHSAKFSCELSISFLIWRRGMRYIN